MSALRRQLHPQNRLHPHLLGRPIEPHRPIHPIVVRHRHRPHPQLPHALHQPVQPTRTVQKRKNAMDMEMDEPAYRHTKPSS